ncbi:hypothetical protein HYH03_015027 [Edaphochlamys debaryana]|uniref:Uncharacterized protein n=1 Tax=Edaphochlamys debaryana TaxID=47281 RepID=A0A835XP25_9CHLO|nr:hypothetical protein HYH03_015027 [Edaphochlamys debaryana]|eukprot:KAG2486323.1 hypothetical protein HYH03_015027 [Edaphochlamys debaryana]
MAASYLGCSLDAWLPTAAPCSASPFSPRLDPTLERFSSEYGSHAAGSSSPPASAGSLAASELLAAPAVNVVPMTSLAPGSEVLTQLAGLHPVLWAELVQAATLLRPAPALGGLGDCTASGRPEPASSMPRLGSAAALAVADLRPLALSSPDSDSATSLAAAPAAAGPSAAVVAAGSGLLNSANSVAAPAAAATAVSSSRTDFAAASAPTSTASTDPDETGGDGAGGRSCLSARWDDALEAATAAFSRSLSWSWDPPPPPPSPPPSPPPASPKAEVPEALLPLGPYGGGGLVAGGTAAQMTACWASAYRLEVPPGGPPAMRTTAALGLAVRASCSGGGSGRRRRGLHEGTVRGGLPRGAAPDGGLSVARGPRLASSW